MNNDDESNLSEFLESLKNQVNFLKVSSTWANVKAFAIAINPGSQEMINYLRWSAMEALNHAYFKRVSADLPPMDEKTIPRDYWVRKTKEIAVEKILKDFKGKGIPETLGDGRAFYNADIVKKSIDETIKFYGKIPYIDEPEYRNSANEKSIIFLAVILCIIIGSTGFIGFKYFSQNPSINRSAPK